MKAFLIIPFVGFMIFSGRAQQDIQVSNFDYFSSFYNPASITRTQHICGNLIGRNQWSGLNGRPNTGFMNVTYNHSDIIWLNLGLTSDVIGNQHSNIVKLGLAKSFTISPNVSISGGINFNFSHFALQSNFITPDTPVPFDLSIPDNDVSTGTFDMDAGIFIRAKNVTLGISSTHITQPTLQGASFNYQYARHYHVLCGYTKRLRIGELENHLLAKSDVASTQMDFKSNLWHNSGWMVGLAYRVADAVVPMVGYQQQFGGVMIRGIYSYDITTSQLNQYSGGSHELCLKICLAPPPSIDRYTHPRHLGTWK
jgi:type IX secretion system PorP/SprF family membrane protein